MTKRTDVMRTPHFPLYSQVRRLPTLLDGVSKPVVTGVIQSIFDQIGPVQTERGARISPHQYLFSVS